MTMRRMAAAMVAALVGIVAVGLGSARAEPPAGVEPVRPFDVNRYAGKWYEIARLDHRFERDLTNVTAEYQVRTDGSVGVTNRGFNPNSCQFEERQGTARFTGPTDTASLEVSFFWPIFGGYYVFDLGSRYEYSMISGPDRSYLWILSRTPEMSRATLSRLVGKARAAGFPVDQLTYVSQAKPGC